MSRMVFSGGRVTCAASRVSVLDFISVPKATITQRPRLFQGGSGSSAQMESKFGGKGSEKYGGSPHIFLPPLAPNFDSTLWGSARCPPAIFFKLFQVKRFVL